MVAAQVRLRTYYNHVAPSCFSTSFLFLYMELQPVNTKSSVLVHERSELYAPITKCHY